MIRIRDTLVPIGQIQGISLIYEPNTEAFYIYVIADHPQVFMCPDRNSGETELQQIQAQYIAIVKEMSE